MGRLRWNEMLGEWVITTPRRASRPFQEEEGECPFCPNEGETAGEWSVLTLTNKYPALEPSPEYPPLFSDLIIETAAHGHCKVIVTSRNHDEQLEDMSNDQLKQVLHEFAKVFQELDEGQNVKYVAQFENRGRAIGVSLNHPHAQVYALPFIPPKIERELAQAKNAWDADKRCIVCDAIENEHKAAIRVLNETANYISCVPFAARLPYETHIYPKKHVGSLKELEFSFEELGEVLRDVARRYAALFDEMAYVMIMHTRPSHGEYPFWHFHVEFYPPWRDKSRRKYLAGIEEGTGTYTNDSTPELSAKQLREAI
ncbi:MAG: galactose-1-phosphate uridylyltransferase [Candidatus Thorarchaeota archaeon]|nr:galactose-1-phosphate uridylyltransferase [Candidatus Thorarchaeota archaeon]